jgi:hypothetical protein
MPVQAQRGGGGIAPTHSQPGTRRRRRRRVFSTTLRPLYAWERLGTNCTGGCMGIGAGLDGTKNLTPSGFNPWAVQLAASRDTNYALPAA